MPAHNHQHKDHNHSGSHVGHDHSNLAKIYQNIKVTPLPDSAVEIEGEVSAEALTHFRNEAIKHFQKEITLPGFRKGKIPEKIVVEKIGELAMLEKAGELALQSCYADMLREYVINPLGGPNVTITKLALGNPMGFKITTAILPEFTLTDYKKIAKEIADKKESNEISEVEIEEAKKTIRRLSLKKDPTEKVEDKDLPPLTEEVVATVGKFENMTDFEIKLKESLVNDKALRNREKIRLGIMKAIMEKNEIPLPKILVDGELNQMMAKMKDDVERMGLKMPDYLKQIGKDEETLRREWENDAKDRARMELILNKISELEKIDAAHREVEAEVKHLLEHYKDADPIKASSYFAHVIRNEKVFQFLESQ